MTSLSLFTFIQWRRQWQPTPVFLPGDSQGQQSLVGCRLWGRTESDVPLLKASRQWWTSHRNPCHTIEPGARNGLWNTEPFISGEGSSRRAIPSRLAKFFDLVLSGDKLGIHLAVKSFEPTNHQHREKWKIFEWGTYILITESQIYSGPSRSRNFHCPKAMT